MKSVGFIYSNAVNQAVAADTLPDLLAADLFVVTGRGWAELQQYCSPDWLATLEPRIFRYIDWWGAGYHTRESSDVPRWFPGPGDPEFGSFLDVTGYSTPHFYRIDQWHEIRMHHAIAKLVQQYPDQAGIFLDDFSWRTHWRLSRDQMDLCWPDRRPGNWVIDRQRRMEGSTRSMLALKNQDLIVNGDSRKYGPRLWESVGHWINIDELMVLAKRGDYVLVKGIDPADRTAFLKTTRPEGGYPVGTSYRRVFADVLRFADERGLIVGLICNGGRGAAHHAYENPKTWRTIA